MWFPSSPLSFVRFFVHFVEFIVRLWFSNRLSLSFQRYRAIPHVHLLIFKPNSLAGALPPEKKRKTQLLPSSSSLVYPFIFLQLFISLFVEREFRLFNFVVFSGRIQVFSSRKRHSFLSLSSFLDRWLDLSKSKTHDFLLSMFSFLPHDGRTVTEAEILHPEGSSPL